MRAVIVRSEPEDEDKAKFPTAETVKVGTVRMGAERGRTPATAVVVVACARTNGSLVAEAPFITRLK